MALRWARTLCKPAIRVGIGDTVPACRWITFHWPRFARSETANTLDLSRRPSDAASWKIGPDGAATNDGGRYKRDRTADRTLFARLRPLLTAGRWQGGCPVETAPALTG